MAQRNSPKTTATPVNKKLADMQRDIDTLAWLYAELMHSMRVAMARQVLAQPQVQQALVDKMIQGGMQNGFAGSAAMPARGQ